MYDAPGSDAGSRRPIARHGRLKSAHPAATVLKFLAASLAVALVSIAAVGVIGFGSVLAKFDRNAVDLGDSPEEIPTIGAHTGAVNMLLVGSDTRTGQKGNYGTDPGSTLNDVNILLHISEDHSKATVVSFPRDLYVDVPECTQPETNALQPAQFSVKINSTLERGGLGCVRNTIAELTGLKIPYVAMITFDGVVQMSNAVGGVDVCVAEPIKDDYTELYLDEGQHTLQGVDALKFLRTRHGVGDGSDLTRISSQQVFLSSFVRTLKSSETLTNIPRLYNIANAASENMTLSKALASPDTMITIARAFEPIDLNKVVFVQYPTVYQGSGVVANPEAAEKLIEALKKDRAIKLNKPSADATAGSVEKKGSSDEESEESAGASDETADEGSENEGEGSGGEPTPSPSATEDTGVELDASGQTAASETCSVGNDIGLRY